MNSSCSEDPAGTKLAAQLESLSERFAIHKEFHRELKTLKLLKSKYLEETYINDALNAKEEEYNTAYLNFLAVLFFDSSKHWQIALDLTEEILKSDSKNFNALWTRARVLHSSQESNAFEKSTKCVNALLISAANKLVIMIAKIEIADIYGDFLGHKFSFRSYEIYYQVLSAAAKAQVPEYEQLEFHNTVSEWKLKLASKYQGPMLTELHPSCEYQKSCLDLVKQLLKDVIKEPDFEGDSEKELWKCKRNRARAMTELANTKFEYFRNSIKTHRIAYGDSDYHFLETDSEYYYKEALYTIAPIKDAEIFICYGQFKDYCADQCHTNIQDISKTVESYLEAVDLYQKAIDLDPENHEILHKIGLVYGRIWAIEEDHQARLKDVRDRQRMWMEKKIGTMLSKYEGIKVVIPPSQPIRPDEVPPPYKMVGFFRQIKAFNFPSHDPTNAYLLKSQQYFKEACEKSEETVRFYLVSLARTYISLRQEMEALLYLEKAERSEKESINMSGFMFEQWAMLVDKMVNSGTSRAIVGELSNELALKYYRESLRVKVKVKTSTMVTLFYFLKLLHDQTQLESEAGNAVIQKEYFLIYMIIQDFKSTNFILEEFGNDEIKIWIAWNLIEMLYERNQNYDAATAFTYLTILSEAGVLVNQPKRGNITKVDTTVRKDRLVFEISKRAVGICFLPGKIVTDTYDWLLQLSNSDVAALAGLEDTNKTICVISSSFENQDVEKVWRILKLCRIPVAHIIMDDFKEPAKALPCLLPEFYTILHRVTKVVFVLDGKNEQDSSLEIINVILKDRRTRPVRTCVASTAKIGSSIRVCGIDLPVCRMHHHDEDRSEQDIARQIDFYSLMEVLFFQQSNWSKYARYRKMLIYERVPDILTEQPSVGVFEVPLHYNTSMVYHHKTVSHESQPNKLIL